jgi:hypothetical protein
MQMHLTKEQAIALVTQDGRLTSIEKGTIRGYLSTKYKEDRHSGSLQAGEHTDVIISELYYRAYGG